MPHILILDEVVSKCGDIDPLGPGGQALVAACQAGNTYAHSQNPDEQALADIEAFATNPVNAYLDQVMPTYDPPVEGYDGVDARFQSYANAMNQLIP